MIANWVDLLAVIDGQLRESELGQESMETRACAASTVERTESADRSAGCEDDDDKCFNDDSIHFTLNNN